MSFRISVSPKRRAAARFVTRVRRELQTALSNSDAVTQADIARLLEVDRSVIHRQLNGRQDIQLGRVAEIALALGYEPDFHLVKIQTPVGSNREVPVQQSSFSAKSESATNTTTISSVSSNDFVAA